MFAQNFRYLRKKHGYSQEAAAKKLGFNKNTIQNYEEGKSQPDINKLISICELYDVKIQHLIYLDLSTLDDQPEQELGDLSQEKLIEMYREAQAELNDIKNTLTKLL